MTPTTHRQPTAKISVQVWRPMFERLDTKVEQACLRRDAWLARVLEVEVEALDREMPYPNAEAARKLVAERLSRLDRKLVSIKLPLTTIARLDEVCARNRIVRDAFFNRLFFLIAAKPDTVRLLMGLETDWWRELWVEHGNDLPFLDNVLRPLDPVIDPLVALRTALEMNYDGVELHEAVDAASGVRYRVVDDLLADPKLGSADVRGTPPDSIYSTFFGLSLPDGRDLIGLNTFIAHERLRELTSPPESSSSDLDSLLGPKGEPS